MNVKNYPCRNVKKLRKKTFSIIQEQLTGRDKKNVRKLGSRTFCIFFKNDQSTTSMAAG